MTDKKIKQMVEDAYLEGLKTGWEFGQSAQNNKDLFHSRLTDKLKEDFWSLSYARSKVK